MRTSLTEIAAIEQQLLHPRSTADRLLFEANQLLDDELHHQVQAQQRAYRLIHRYGRQSMKAELENVYQQLLTQPQHASFMQRIKQLFKCN